MFDPTRKVTVTRDLLHQNVDHTPYEGFAVTGWPAITISRGEVVFENGTVVGRPRRGRFVKRKATASGPGLPSHQGDVMRFGSGNA